MKTSLVSALFLLVLISCTHDATVDPTEVEPFAEHYPQKWQLTKMTGSWTNSVTTGKDMDWQEYYVFNSNGTFLKSRTRAGVTTEASGTFRYEKGKDASETTFLSLTYASQNDLIASCTSRELTETLVVASDKTLTGTWSMCDGPGLTYQWIE